MTYLTLSELKDFNNIRFRSYDGGAISSPVAYGSLEVVVKHHNLEQLFTDGKLLIELDNCGGSDYSGGTANRSNYLTFLKEYGELDQVFDCYGGYGTYTVLVQAHRVTQDIGETLAALSDYPLMDDETHSQFESDGQSEWWASSGESEFFSELKKAFDFFEIDPITEEDSDGLWQAQKLRDLFWSAEAKQSLVCEGGYDNWYVDMAKLVKKISLEDILECLDTWILGSGITSDILANFMNKIEAAGFPCTKVQALEVLQGAWPQVSDPEDPDEAELERVLNSTVFGHFQCHQLSIEVF